MSVNPALGVLEGQALEGGEAAIAAEPAIANNIVATIASTARSDTGRRMERVLIRGTLLFLLAYMYNFLAHSFRTSVRSLPYRSTPVFDCYHEPF